MAGDSLKIYFYNEYTSNMLEPYFEIKIILKDDKIDWKESIKTEDDSKNY